MQRDPIRKALEQSEFFEGIGPEELPLLRATMRRRAVGRGATLFAQGDAGDSMVLVARGELEVRVRSARGAERRVQVVRPGDVVGEMACIDPAPRSASVMAIEQSLVYELDRHLLAYLRREAPSLIVAVVGSVIAQLTARLRATDVRIEAELLRIAGHAKTPTTPLPRMDPGPPPQRHLGSTPKVDLDPLQGLDPGDLARLSAVAPARTWQDRSLLCHEGDPGRSCFLMVAGEVDVVRVMRGKRRRLATLGAGSLVGQAALVDHAPRSASLRARGTVVAFELDRSTFERLLSRASPLAMRFQEEIAVSGIRQLRSATERLAQLLSKTQGARRSRRSRPERPNRPHTSPSRSEPAGQGTEQDPLDFVRAALSEWGMRVEDLEEIEFTNPEGLIGAAEAARRKLEG